jgi:hypothetical protein
VLRPNCKWSCCLIPDGQKVLLLNPPILVSSSKTCEDHSPTQNHWKLQLVPLAWSLQSRYLLQTCNKNPTTFNISTHVIFISIFCTVYKKTSVIFVVIIANKNTAICTHLFSPGATQLGSLSGVTSDVCRLVGGLKTRYFVVFYPKITD